MPLTFPPDGSRNRGAGRSCPLLISAAGGTPRREATSPRLEAAFAHKARTAAAPLACLGFAADIAGFEIEAAIVRGRLAAASAIPAREPLAPSTAEDAGYPRAALRQPPNRYCCLKGE